MLPLWLRVELGVMAMNVFVAASHQTGLDTRSKAQRQIKVGSKGRGRSGTRSRSGHLCQNIAWTRPRGLVLYKGCIGDKKAARPPEVGPTEVGGLSASNLPLVLLPHPTWMPDGPVKRPGKWWQWRPGSDGNERQGVMAMKGYCSFPKLLALLQPHHQIV